MVTDFATTESPSQAIAHEVIVSAGNILGAAGFKRNEIAGFFRQAADQLGDAADRPSPAWSVGDGPRVASGQESRADRSLADLQADFSGISAVRALANIAVDPEMVARLRGGSEPARPHLDLALRMFPYIAEAQNWLRDTAREAGYEIVTDRRQWLAAVPAEALAQDRQVVFLEDFEAACKPCLDFVTALVAAIESGNDSDALNILLHGLVSCGIIVTYALKIELESAVAKLIPRSLDAAL